VVLPDSHGISRAPCYLGYRPEVAQVSPTGVSPSVPDAFQTSSATQTISYFLPDQQLWLGGPTTPVTQRLLAMTRDRFGLFPFRSPLLRESLLLSLPVGTEMFHFPTLPPPALCVQAGAMGHYAPSGFPIRKSPDRSLVADSPGLIAGSYVLHRLLVPRHPPCALTNLANTLRM
jgi:hypothetical protein